MIILWLMGCGTKIETEESGQLADSGGLQDSATVPDIVPDTVADENGDFLFDDSTILDFGLTVDAAALASLAADPATDVHATFTFLDQAYDVALHLKGGASGHFRNMDEKAGLKVDFHEWDTDQRFYRLKRLTLNSMIQDSTMSHEHAAYRLFRDLGVPAPRHGYARVTVNGEWFGLYGNVETVDEEFLENAFPDDPEGNLYEGGYGGDFGEGQAKLFEVKESIGDGSDISDLEALVDIVENAEPADMLPLIATYFEAEQLYSMWGGELVIADTDGYTSNANNFLVYHSPATDRWTMLPWGPDQAFLEDGGVWVEFIGKLAEKCAAAADCKAEMAAGIERAVAVLETAEYVNWMDAETARIEHDCRADPRSEWGNYGCRDALIAMREWVRARPARVRDDL